MTVTLNLPKEMFQMAILLLKENTGLCKIIFMDSMHKFRSYGSDKLIYVTFKCDLAKLPKRMLQMALLLFKDNNCVK